MGWVGKRWIAGILLQIDVDTLSAFGFMRCPVMAAGMNQPPLVKRAGFDCLGFGDVAFNGFARLTTHRTV